MLARLRRFTTALWHAWRAALPFHLAFAILAVSSVAALRAQTLGPSPDIATLPNPATAFKVAVVFVLTGLASWAYAGQSIRPDFTWQRGLTRAPALLWRAGLVLAIGALGLGNPLTQEALLRSGATSQVGLGFTFVVGLMAAAAFVLLEWAARVGNAPTPHAHPTVWASMRADLRAGWQMLRLVWRRLPAALTALVGTLFVVSFALQIPVWVGHVLLGDLPLSGATIPYVAMVVALPVLALCPTAAALAIHQPQAPQPDKTTAPTP